MIHPLVIGTAGHVDHGKTALVRALTGIDTDRLPVEKARGITTELGFARLDLGERRVAVVDVPGHERFVKSMVAGATGLDLVMLVIAADEGVMPQTREHLDICELLGVRRGVIVLAKRDLVDPEWLALVTADVRAAVAGTFLAGAPLVAVSAKTGEGLDELRAILEREISALEPRATTGVFRLPIDRVFTVKGFGTIVTGTILSGEIALGDELAVIPSGRLARVRGLEVHGTAVERACAGLRCAINLGGIAVDELARGEMLVHPGRVAGSHILDVELRALVPIAMRKQLLVHHGTAQVPATLVRLDDGFAQLRLDRTRPLGALPGDRFIVRAAGATIGGGRVVRVLAPKARKGHVQAVAALAGARLDQRLAIEIQTAEAAGVAIDALVQRLGAAPAELAAPLAELVDTGELLAIGGDHYLHARAVAELEAAIVAELAAPEGAPREDLRTRLPAALLPRAYDKILAGLAARSLVTLDGDRVRRSTSPPRAALSATETAVLGKLTEAGIEPPRPKELGLPDAQLKPALDRLIAAKLVVRIKPDLVMAATIVDDVRTRLVAFLADHATIDAQQWKELTGASRKYTIPLAELFDAEKLTLRVGDLRRLRAQPTQKK